jgi:hypothetical protein
VELLGQLIASQSTPSRMGWHARCLEHPRRAVVERCSSNLQTLREPISLQHLYAVSSSSFPLTQVEYVPSDDMEETQPMLDEFMQRVNAGTDLWFPSEGV